MPDSSNTYCKLLQLKYGGSFWASLRVLYLLGFGSLLNREVQFPSLPILIISRIKQKWLANKSLSMLQSPFIQTKLKSIGTKAQHLTNDLTYCINANKSLFN